jgi:hypothetical protein
VCYIRARNLTGANHPFVLKSFWLIPIPYWNSKRKVGID